MDLYASKSPNEWLDSVFENNGREYTLRTLLPHLGDSLFDAAAYLERNKESLAQRFCHFITWRAQDCPEVIAYWREKGLSKQVFHAGDRSREWSLFTPVSASRPENAGRRYPLLIIMHGGGDSVYFAETYGYLQLACEQELIVAIPSDEEDASVMAITRSVISTSPVDDRRIYLAGFSYGGGMTIEFAMAHPEMVSAVIMLGAHLRGYRTDDRDAVHANAARYRLPVINIIGRHDVGHAFPMYQDNPPKNAAIELPPLLDPSKVPEKVYPKRIVLAKNTPAENVDAVNLWLSINGCKAVRLDDCLALGQSRAEIADTGDGCGITDETRQAELRIGIPLEKAYTRFYDSTTYYFGDFFDDEGNCLVRLVAVDGMPHWPTGQQNQIAWDFVRNFVCDEQGISRAVL